MAAALNAWCKHQCGRRAAVSFDICCPKCQVGHPGGGTSHGPSCNSAHDRLLSSLIFCKNFCGREVATGFDTCCRSCQPGAPGGGNHGPLCVRQNGEVKLCSNRCGRSAARGFSTCCASCRPEGGSHGPLCLRACGPAAPLLPAHIPPPANVVGGGRQKCCNDCGRWASDGYEACCRSCRRGAASHGPMCDANNQDIGAPPQSLLPPGGGVPNQAQPPHQPHQQYVVPQPPAAQYYAEGDAPKCARQHCERPAFAGEPICLVCNYGAEIPPQPVPASRMQPSRVFYTNHITGRSMQAVRNWLPNLSSAEKKASRPPFNLRYMQPGDEEREMHSFDIPVFGPKLMDLVLSIFDPPKGTKDKGLRETASMLKVRIPSHTINEVVQNRMSRVEELIQALKADSAVASQEHFAITKLESFVSTVKDLSPNKVQTPQQWTDTVSSLVHPEYKTNWQDKLHTDEVLRVFGFGTQTSQKYVTLPLLNDPRLTWGQYSVRWLSKAFSVYGVQGSFSDVVNLIYAMMSNGYPRAAGVQPGRKPDAGDVVAMMEVFKGKLQAPTKEARRQNCRDLWIPTHLVHDAELDDSLAWLLLHYVSKDIMQGPPPHVLVQLPGYEEFRRLEEHLKSNTSTNVEVFFDVEAQNAAAVRLYWGTQIKDLYVQSALVARSFVGKYTGKMGYVYVGTDGKLFKKQGNGKWSFSIKPLQYNCQPDVEERVWLLESASQSSPWPHLVTDWNSMDVGPNYNLIDKSWKTLKSRAEWKALEKDSFSMLEEAPRCQEAGCTAEAEHDGCTHCESHKFAHQTHHKTKMCPKYHEAIAFVEAICPEVKSFLFPKADHCYCASCHTGGDMGEGNHIIPRGWVGLAIAMPKGTHFSWDTVFHGTTPELLADILHHKHIGMPGDLLPTGTILRGKNSANRDDPHFYTSPTVNYASLQLYSTACKFGDGRKAGQVVLQCKQDPTTVYKKQRETMGFAGVDTPGDAVCKYTNLYEDGIERCSMKPKGCIPQRILVRTFDLSGPPNYLKPIFDPVFQNKITFEAPHDSDPGTKRGLKGVYLGSTTQAARMPKLLFQQPRAHHGGGQQYIHAQQQQQQHQGQAGMFGGLAGLFAGRW